jgi:hypothetical protein
MANTLLTLNAGSSSIKFSVFEVDPASPTTGARSRRQARRTRKTSSPISFTVSVMKSAAWTPSSSQAASANIPPACAPKWRRGWGLRSTKPPIARTRYASRRRRRACSVLSYRLTKSGALPNKPRKRPLPRFRREACLNFRDYIWLQMLAEVAAACLYSPLGTTLPWRRSRPWRRSFAGKARRPRNPPPVGWPAPGPRVRLRRWRRTPRAPLSTRLNLAAERWRDSSVR